MRADGRVRHVRVGIIGAGFAGLGMAAQLARHGRDDFLLVERAREVGGTWRDNSYPGAACDIRSDLYSFSFAPNADWARRYAPQPEILEYLKGVADRFELRPHILFDAELLRAEWSDRDSAAGTDAHWTVETSRETFTCTVLVVGAGPLIEPKWPAIPGLETFAGPRFHSARWRHDVELAGADVAVIGTGASAIQFVPEVQKVARSVTVYQRSAPWIVPRADGATSPGRRRRFARYPALQRMSRAAVFASAEFRFLGFRFRAVGRLFEAVSRAFLRREVKDPTLRAQLAPDFRIGCKRILISSDYYRALTQPNVTLVTEPIASLDADAVITADGVRRRADVVIGGTGFDATHPPIARVIVGRGGVSLSERWASQMSALHGTTVTDFPNMFLLVGPNTALGHNSIVAIIEAQLGYVLEALEELDTRGADWVEPDPSAQLAHNEKLQHALRGSVWESGCANFYLDETGRNTTLWPGTVLAFRRALRRLDPAEFVWMTHH
jgi:cation diffusion facilitator CzcD-associated flavoprotein CzcO